MKKATLTLVVLILATSFATSQSLTKGFKGGLNIATLGGADADNADLKSITTFSAGVFFNLSLPGPISIQPEVLYSQKGAKSSVPGLTVTYNLVYVEVPVLLKFNIPLAPGSPVKPNIFAGPAVGFLLTAKVKADPPSPPALPAETDIKDQTTNTDFGVVFGAGLDIDLVALQLTIDARYNLGLTTIDKNGNSSGTKADIKNRVMSVNVGIAL
ncbi:MAG: porin family protein [Bacteroidota bacterium]